jgi:hypothetical protein
MSRTEIAAIRKADGAEIRVALNIYKGRRVIDVRVWYKPPDGSDYVPTRKGITIDADKLPELVAAMKLALPENHP